jgi:hypothetical protein
MSPILLFSAICIHDMVPWLRGRVVRTAAITCLELGWLWEKAKSGLVLHTTQMYKRPQEVRLLPFFHRLFIALQAA